MVADLRHTLSTVASTLAKTREESVAAEIRRRLEDVQDSPAAGPAGDSAAR
ncbi:hypothetical protein [Phytohabitans rumicis]|uniref:Uncharacterized protein n=1 Tax=Phytohabitans rumicis TaxID=1076125 RepID=A0A6V8L9Z4_9ACTN|nr:hypothetical protein [Phytohabitans rumicis]GFJ93164.1 hypothetical protein Prum_068060 [Phytohabitans rumicis]